MPILQDARPITLFGGGYKVTRSDVTQDGGIRDVAALFEERVTNGETHGFTLRVGLAISTRGECERGQCRRRKVLWVECDEKIRGDLLPQFSNVRRGCLGILGSPIDQLKGPSVYEQRDVDATELPTALSDDTQADVGEGTPNVRVDIDGHHIPYIKTARLSRDLGAPPRTGKILTSSEEAGPPPPTESRLSTDSGLSGVLGHVRC